MGVCAWDVEGPEGQDQCLLISDQGGNEHVTSALFLSGACFAMSAFFSNTYECTSWVTHTLQSLISQKSSYSQKVLLLGACPQWRVIMGGAGKPGKSALLQRHRELPSIQPLVSRSLRKKRLSTFKIHWWEALILDHTMRNSVSRHVPKERQWFLLLEFCKVPVSSWSNSMCRKKKISKNLGVPNVFPSEVHKYFQELFLWCQFTRQHYLSHFAKKSNWVWRNSSNMSQVRKY